MVETLRRSGDPLLLDRITLEFAGLCSQIFSAEGVPENTPEALVKTVKKAAGYVNVGIERWCGRDLGLCERFCGKTPCPTFFARLQPCPGNAVGDGAVAEESLVQPSGFRPPSGRRSGARHW